MKKISRQGLQALNEIFSSDIKKSYSMGDKDLEERLVQASNDYLRQAKTYEETERIFKEAGMRTEIVAKMKDIIECALVPLPCEASEDDSKKKSRSWSQVEDTRLLAGIYRNGLDNWSTVAMFVGNGRTRAQCAQRWSRGLNPRISRDTWTQEQETMLMQYVAMFGDKAWTKIATLLGNRSDVQCRYHYMQLAKSGRRVALPCVQQPYFPPMRTAIRNSMPTMPIADTAQYQFSMEPRRSSMIPQIPVVPGKPPAEIESSQTKHMIPSIDGFLRNFQ